MTETISTDPSSVDRLKWWEWLMPLAIVIIVVARGFWGASFWLDETLSSWVVQNGFAEIWSRATTYQPQSLLYYYVLDSWINIAGNSEGAYRVLSAIFLLIALVGLFEFVRPVVSARTALASCVILLACDPFLKALSARPYAMALALAMWALVAAQRWLEKGSSVDRWWHLLLAIAAIYTQVTFIGFLIVPILWWKTFRKEQAAREILVNLLFVIVCSVPILWQSYTLLTQLPSIGADVDIGMLARALVPANLLIYVVCGFLVALISVNGARPVTISDRIFYPAIIWYVLPVITLFFLAFVSGGSLFVDRYYLWAVPGLAIGCGILLTSFSRPLASSIALCIAALLIFGRESGRRWQIEDWRGAVESINQIANVDDSLVLIYSGLVESDAASWLTDPERADYLVAPFQRYKVTPQFQNLPSQIEGPEMRGFLVDTLIPKIKLANSIFVIANNKFNQHLQVGVIGYYAQVLTEFGFQVKDMRSFGEVSMLEMVRGSLGTTDIVK